MLNLKGKYWLVSADMGYGHQRAIYPLEELALQGEIINVNSAAGSTMKERRRWSRLVAAYEFLSRTGKLPFIGRLITDLLNYALYIPDNFTKRDLSRPTFQVRFLKNRIKKGMGKGMLERIGRSDLPLITSFYLPAIAAEMAGHKEIYCIICDTDLNRVWVSEFPSKSNIVYFAPVTRARDRLISYGVHANNIKLTGFPLPIELTGDRSLDILKQSLAKRLINLDPEGRFLKLHHHEIKDCLGEYYQQAKSGPLTITFAVGGAGAQKEIGLRIARSLEAKIKSDEVILNLVAGTKPQVRDFFLRIKERMGNSGNIRIIWAEETKQYFELFSRYLHMTDILWSKPCELSFYCALGLPVIMAPPIGPQEISNQRWLCEIGAGFGQQDPDFTHQWLFDFLSRGNIAAAAWNGFMKAPKYGTYNIMDYLESGMFNSEKHYF